MQFCRMTCSSFFVPVLLLFYNANFHKFYISRWNFRAYHAITSFSRACAALAGRPCGAFSASWHDGRRAYALPILFFLHVLKVQGPYPAELRRQKESTLMRILLFFGWPLLEFFIFL